MLIHRKSHIYLGLYFSQIEITQNELRSGQIQKEFSRCLLAAYIELKI